MLPSFPFTFRKNYGIAGARNIVFTATQGNSPGWIAVTWTGNGIHDVTLQYTEYEVNTYIEAGRIPCDSYDGLTRWTLCEQDGTVGVYSAPVEEPDEIETPAAVVYTGSLGDLKQDWKDTIHGDGGSCPVCERFGKVYDRTINDTMARSLQWMADQATEHGLRTWIDVPNTAPLFVLRSNQLSTLRWWGLVERQLPDPVSKSKHSGKWRITLKGMDFVEGTTQVPKKVFTYNAEVVSYSADTTTFEACKGKLFDYQKVMQTTHITHIALGKSLFPANDALAQAA